MVIQKLKDPVLTFAGYNAKMKSNLAVETDKYCF
jgi:hypothetical protein